MASMRTIVPVALALTAMLVLPHQAHAEKLTRTVEFKTPSIKDDFCGAKIDYKICKCARHGELCKEIGRTEDVAKFILNSKYNAYVQKLLADFGLACGLAGGTFQGRACKYYEATDKEKQCLPDNFDTNWKKYSDIDDAVPVNERSFETKQHAEKLAKMVENTQEIFLLTRDMEIDRLSRLAVKEYKQALVKGIKANLLRAFWRLAWITYDNIQSGRSAGGTFEKMYDLPSWSEGIAAGLKTVRSVTPGDSAIAINTESVSGKVKSVGLSTALDALESVGDPVTIATTLVSESVKNTFGSADISPEEIKILENEHLKNRFLDNIIQESYRKNADRRAQVNMLKSENETLRAELNELEIKERGRVLGNIIESCKDKKK